MLAALALGRLSVEYDHGTQINGRNYWFANRARKLECGADFVVDRRLRLNLVRGVSRSRVTRKLDSRMILASSAVA